MYTQPPEIFILRHGQTEWNNIKRQQGRLNSDLTAIGREHAKRQGEILRRLDIPNRQLPIFSSPLGRTQQTADIVVSSWGGKHRADDRLIECDLGVWQGLFEHDIQLNWPDAYSRRLEGSVEWYLNDAHGGETFEQLRDRSAEFLASLTGPTVIITHSITSHILRGIWLGLGREEMCALPSGQGWVYHLHHGKHTVLKN